MKYLLALAILAVSYHGVIGEEVAEDCNAQECEAAVGRILQKTNYDCWNEPARIISALAPCQKPECPQAVRDYLVPLGQRIERKAIESNCPAGLTRGQRDCSLAQSFECAMGSANLAFIFPNLQITDIAKLCLDVSKILQTVNVCQMCVQGLIPGWQGWSAQIDLIFNISVTLGNGACNCSRMIVNHVANINLTTPCSTVRTIVDFTRTIASDCAVKLVNYPLKLEWLEIVDNYINFFLPFTGSFCGLVSGQSSGSMSSVLNLSFLLVPLLFLLFLRRLRH